jgi:hypothetical protein
MFGGARDTRSGGCRGQPSPAAISPVSTLADLSHLSPCMLARRLWGGPSPAPLAVWSYSHIWPGACMGVSMHVYMERRGEEGGERGGRSRIQEQNPASSDCPCKRPAALACPGVRSGIWCDLRALVRRRRVRGGESIRMPSPRMISPGYAPDAHTDPHLSLTSSLPLSLSCRPLQPRPRLSGAEPSVPHPLA